MANLGKHVKFVQALQENRELQVLQDWARKNGLKMSICHWCETITVSKCCVPRECR